MNEKQKNEIAWRAVKWVFKWATGAFFIGLFIGILIGVYLLS